MASVNCTLVSNYGISVAISKTRGMLRVTSKVTAADFSSPGRLAHSYMSCIQVPGQTVITRTHHRPLSWYFRTLRAAGLVVAALEEPEPTEEFLASSSQGPWIAEIPLHCVIEAWKVE